MFDYAGAAGGFLDKFGYPYCHGRIYNKIEADNGQYDTISKIFWACGACFFIRKEVFEVVGGFDDNYWAHMEEIDLCWRIQNLGYHVKYHYKSRVYHFGSVVTRQKEKNFFSITDTGNKGNKIFLKKTVEEKILNLEASGVSFSMAVYSATILKILMPTDFVLT